MKIPYRIPSWWPPLEDWLNAGKPRRIDIILLVLGLICIIYYALTYPIWWHGALMGFAGFILYLTIALIFRRD